MRKLVGLLVISMISLLSCQKEKEIGDQGYIEETIIGKWALDYVYVKYISSIGYDTTYNQECTFEFKDNGTVLRPCALHNDTLSWYYRENPIKLIFVDENNQVSSIETYDIETFGNDLIKMESFISGVLPNPEADSFFHHEILNLTRL